MKNAAVRANAVIATANDNKQSLSLGPLHYSVEESLVFEERDNTDIQDFETFALGRLNRIVICQLSSVFEVECPPRVRKVV